MKKIFLTIYFLILISLPFLVQAAGLVPCGGKGEPPCQFCHLFVLFNNIVKFVLTKIVPPLAVLMLAIGGFMYVFAYLNPEGGSPTLISKANSLFKSVFIGLIIIFGAWLIVSFFFQIIGVAEWTGLKTWWQVKGCE